MIDTSGNNSRSRPTVRTAHVRRPLEVVDLLGLLAEEDADEDGGSDVAFVDADFNTFSEEDALSLAFGVDEEVVEDPEDSQEGLEGRTEEVEGNSHELVRPLYLIYIVCI